VDDPDPDMGFKNRHFETYKATGSTEDGRMPEAFLISRDSCLTPSCLFASFVVSPSPQSPKDAHHGQEAAGFDHEEREETRRMEGDERRERVASWLLTQAEEIACRRQQEIITYWNDCLCK